MKKTQSAVVLLVLISILSLVFMSCTNDMESPRLGSLSISTDVAVARTIQPSEEKIKVFEYRVTGTGPSGETLESVTSPITPITINGLVEGKWSITVDGLNATKGMVSTKTQNVIIFSGQETSATFLLGFPSGTGTASITINWPSSVTSFSQIRGTITPTTAGVDGFTVTPSGGLHTITQTIEGIPSGSYQFKLEFLDVLGNSVGLSYRESLNVYKDMVSTKNYVVPEEIFPIETPVISMDSSYKVSITCDTESTVIHYITEEGELGTDSLVYGDPFTITQNTVVKAFAIREDRLSSAVAVATLEAPASAPTFSVGSGTYDEAQSIVIGTTTNEATIYYTTTGVDPTNKSTPYTVPVVVNQTMTLKAIAVKDSNADSTITSATYTILGSSGVQVVDLPNYTVSIQLPEGWKDGIVVTGAVGTVRALVEPLPVAEEVSYAWYLDGAVMTNNTGTGVMSSAFEFGSTDDDVSLNSGPHMLSVEIEKSGITFSDQKVIQVSSTGSVGTVGDPYLVGDLGPSGGYIFYNNPNWETDGWRYLEAAPVRWNGTSRDPEYIFGRVLSNGVTVVVGTGTEIGTGKANTEALIVAMNESEHNSGTGSDETMYAAKACAVYRGGGNEDWFLPSKDELNQMHLNLNANGPAELCDYYYWSSSESSAGDAWMQRFYYGVQVPYIRYDVLRVRPVRAF